MDKRMRIMMIGIILLGCSTAIAYSYYSSLTKNAGEELSIQEAKTTQDNGDTTKNGSSDIKKDGPKTQEAPGQNPGGSDTNQNAAPKNEASHHEILNGTPIGKRHKLNSVTQTQRKWYWCAPTTVSIMLATRGKHISQEQLAGEMGTYEPFGTHNKNAIKVLNRHMFGYDSPAQSQAGYRIETVTDTSQNTLATLKSRIMQNTKDGYPMYFTINPKKMYANADNSEHNVAGVGYIATPDEKDVAFVYYIDPYGKFHDSQYGGLKVVTPEQLVNAMVDPYVTEPNYAW